MRGEGYVETWSPHRSHGMAYREMLRGVWAREGGVGAEAVLSFPLEEEELPLADPTEPSYTRDGAPSCDVGRIQ